MHKLALLNDHCTKRQTILLQVAIVKVIIKRSTNVSGHYIRYRDKNFRHSVTSRDKRQTAVLLFNQIKHPVSYQGIIACIKHINL